MKISRRNLLKLGVLGASVKVPAFLPAVWGQEAPSNRLRVGAIGLGERGRYDAGLHRAQAELVALCDLDANRLQSANGVLCGGKGELFADYRRLLDRKDIDVVCIATPDHWHTKNCLDALDAGKHVFCEKPLTLTVRESQVLRDKARACAKQTFAVGTQRRMEVPTFTRAVNMVQQGLLGKIHHVLVSISKSFNAVAAPPKDKRFRLMPVPEGFDWETWQGQAPVFPYRENRGHARFRYWYEYAGGRVADWGAHYIDTALWALGLDQPGKGIISVDPSDCNHPLPMKDGYPTEHDYYNTAHDFYLKAVLSDGTALDLETRLNDGILFEGEKGRIFVNCGRITGVPVEENWDKELYGPEQQKGLFKGKPTTDHITNFYRCIREGGLPTSDIFSHLQTMNACHVFNIAARLGRTLTWNPADETFPNDPQANSFLTREQRKGFEVC